MSEEVISLFNCQQASSTEQFSVAPAVAVEEKGYTVKESVQTSYVYMEEAARKFTRWLTVTAESLFSTIKNRIRAFVRHASRMTGVQILHQFAILRI